MYIISKFHDYYDSAAIYGIDKSIIYERNTVVVDPILSKDPFRYYDEKKKFVEHIKINLDLFLFLEHQYYSDNVLLSFCGKCYIGSRIYSTISENTHDEGFLWMNSLEEKIQSMLHEKKVKPSYYDILSSSLIKLNTDYSKITSTLDLSEFHREHNSPLILIKYNSYKSKYSLIINPSLKDFNFYRIVDPSSAFQEIQSYISGVLGSKEKSTITVSEKDKLLQHGMDPKWSFRNPDPPKRKKK